LALETWGTDDKKFIESRRSRIQSQQRQEKELIELGATSAASTQEPQPCDVVITMLSNDEAVKEVYESENGLLSQDNPGKLIINMSTVSPETSI
jgi:3-hydroxyisobutyrate dehydrogenase